ncbi:lysine 2,3-aminomutase [Rhodovulum sp. BSW8]|uniref:KamA family radical SAM protein n=1 Tax=Rhodovulum sp. BSW8 TaxID=2259645 RepID=UPI000DE3FDAB|nr:KamA family radical SAM protein [Rhodovulum sp. BSW8]RBO53426.1 lysine 2,3-aminomutase [Rhodovulum sp. BSW8]
MTETPFSDRPPARDGKTGAPDSAAPSAPSAPPREAARRSAFPSSPGARAFRRRVFPEATAAEWSDWRWQLRARIRSLDGLERVFRLTEDERAAVARHKGGLPVGITPYYASLMGADDPAEPLRRTHIPVGQEYLRLPGESDDPLGEDPASAVPGLVHRYPDRALFLATGTCSTYCRYCTRSRMVGQTGGEQQISARHWERAFAYIEATPQIRDVLVSGGDPLTLSDDKLDYLLGRLRAIPHVEFIRIGTKVPLVLPMRITRALTRMLRKHHPLWMSVHCTHPAELTLEATEALTRLADAGLPLGAQTVLLKGINDHVETLRTLYRELLRRRVRPYYLLQCDPITGSGQFRTPVETGLDLIDGLRGHLTGYAVPQYIIDAPGGGGKVALVPDHIEGRDGDDLLLRNFEGRIYRYPDPGGRIGAEKPRS